MVCCALQKGFNDRKWGRGLSKKWGGVTTGSNVIAHKPKLPHIAIYRLEDYGNRYGYLEIWIFSHDIVKGDIYSLTLLSFSRLILSMSLYLTLNSINENCTSAFSVVRCYPEGQGSSTTVLKGQDLLLFHPPFTWDWV